MSRRLNTLRLFLFLVAVVLAPASAAAQITPQGATLAASGHTSVIHGVAYAARHDVYLTVYEGPTGIRGRFVNAAGATVGDVFAIATTPGQAIVYANKPMVAYSTDSADDVFFVMYGTDFGKAPDAQPSAWIQRVSYTGTGGVRLGDPIRVGDGGWEIPNDLIFNPVTRQFVAVWERFYSEGPDVMVRFFNANGTAATGIVNVTNANHGQGAAKAAVDWERNRILIAYQGLHPNSPVNPEVLGLWAKIIDGSTGALLTGLLTVQSGFTIEPMPIFLPEVDGFLTTWTAFNPGRDVHGRYVSSATGAEGAMPNPVYALSGSGRQEGAAMGMYDAASRRVLMAVQSSGGCPNDTCPFLDGAVLDGQGVVLSSFTGLSTAVPSVTGGSFYPDVAVGENGQFGFSYTLNYAAVFVERVALPVASTPGPQFGGGPVATTGVTVAPSSLSFTVTKAGATLGAVTPQSVTLSFSTGTAGAWSAASSSPWIQIGSASGSGDGQFTVTIVNPSNVIGAQTSLSGSVVVTAATAPNAPVTIPVALTVSQASTPGAAGVFQPLGATLAASGHTTVVNGLAYSARHDVYLSVYEGPDGIRGRFVNAGGVAVGDVFMVAALGQQALAYANKPMVAYSTDTADDVFFVMYATDLGKTPDAVPSAWIQRVSFTGTGGARVGTPILVGDGGWEIPNDIVFNPATRQFVAVWERFFSEGPDVMVRFFNVDGTAATGIVNVTNARHGQGAAKAAVDWERNRILIAYQGLHPNSPVNPEVLGLWAKVVDGTTGALLTGLLTVQSGFTIEAMPVFLPEVDGFLVTWTAFNPGRDVHGRYVSSAEGAVGTMPNPVYALAASSRQEGAAMGMYDGISRRVLLAVQSSGGCPNDTCPFLDGSILDGQGTLLSNFTGLSTATPSSTGGSFYPDVAVGENGQFGISYALNYAAVYVERASIGAAATPGPIFGGGPAVTGVSMAPASVSLAISKAGAAISTVAPQAITVTFSSGTEGAWTVASSVPWLRVTSGTGTGNGQFTVTVINPSNVIGSQTSLSGSVVLTSATAPNSPVTLPVTLSVSTVTLPAGAPFGQVDTPVQNATGVQGALAITGWALDDTSVIAVNIYRDCLSVDSAQSCQMILGNNVVWLGTAAFLPGARSDVEAAFPLYPNANRAGWGIQILTNQLPHLTNGQPTGGSGTMSFMALATDASGNHKVLGRSSSATSPDFSALTRVTLANDTIAKPFGSIDTPTLGQTVSGVIPNFGWALTPDSNTTAGDVDIVIPTDGSTVTVYVDGVARANVPYNLCRGSVANPIPGASFCDDDIASTFGNATAQATFTARASNPTRFRNLDAGRGAIGAYVLDTTTLSNGLHTIAWAVMDSAGRTEGVGSRFFTVANGATDAQVSALRAAPTAVRAGADEIEGMPAGDGGIWARTGFDLRQPWVDLAPDANGERHVRIAEMDRAEVWLGSGVDAAYLVANGTLRDLPVGAAITGGHFTWVPGPGAIGPYQMAFLRRGERIDVFITVVPATSVGGDEAEVRMHLDRVDVTGSAPGERTVRVDGWALDPQAAIGAGIGAVHVWAKRVGPGGQAPVFLGEATLQGDRPDVAAAFGARFNRAGFSFTSQLGAGTWEVTAYVWNRRTGRFEDARTLTVTVR